LGTAYPPLSAISRLQLDPMAISKSPYPRERVDDSPIWRSAGDCALNRVQAQHDSIETENPPLSAIFGLQLDPMAISRSPYPVERVDDSPIWRSARGCALNRVQAQHDSIRNSIPSAECNLQIAARPHGDLQIAVSRRTGR